MTDAKYYVYLHRRATDGKVFYVGQGCGDRCNQTKRTPAWDEIVLNHGRTVEIVKDGLTQQEAYELEELEIAKYGRADLGLGLLCNQTNGGKRNLGISDKNREAVRQAMIGNKKFLGRKHSEKAKQKMRQPRTEETKQKMRKPKSDEMKAKLSATKGIKVKCSNGMTFKSGLLAEVWLKSIGKLKADNSAILRCCNGRLKTAYGYKWTHA